MFCSRLIISGPQGRESLSAARIPARLMLLQPDLEERNKQHWPGVLRMCFLTAAAVVINPDDDMLDRWFEAPGCAAMSQYWQMHQQLHGRGRGQAHREPQLQKKDQGT